MSHRRAYVVAVAATVLAACHHDSTTSSIGTLSGDIVNGVFSAMDTMHFDFGAADWQHSGTRQHSTLTTPAFGTYGGGVSATLDLGAPYGPTPLTGSWFIVH
jgi:hypothetical protein